MTLPDPREPDDEAPAPPVARAVVQPPQDDTPAYGIPAAPAHQPWPDDPALPPDPAETARLRAVPDPGPRPGGGGGVGGPEKRTRPAFRRLLPLVIASGAVVALGGTAVALLVLPGSAGSDTALLDAKASAPVTSLAPADPSPSSTILTTGPTPSASPSRSPSPSASKSASPSPSPSTSRSSAPPSTIPSPTPPRAPSPTPPPQAPTLRYGDSGAEVERLQRLLAARGLYSGKFNGKFDWRVENAVSTFQYDNDIDEEWGVYGPATRKALEG
ncbi:peptidoglycan-binding domain-containing protein [Streptomyces sp. NPDC002587]